MKHPYFDKLLISTCIGSSFVISCNRDPYIPDYKNAKGFVIAKETCNTAVSLLGHFNIKATEKYLHVSKKQLVNIVSPFDDLWKNERIEW